MSGETAQAHVKVANNSAVKVNHFTSKVHQQKKRQLLILISSFELCLLMMAMVTLQNTETLSLKKSTTELNLTLKKQGKLIFAIF